MSEAVAIESPSGREFGRSTLAGILVAALAVAAVPGAAGADALQDRVVAGARAVPESAFAFTQTTRIERPGATAKVFVRQFDPAQPPDRRWTLVAIDGRPPTAKEAADARKAAKAGKGPGYGRVADWFGAPAARIAGTSSSVTYRFARLPKGVLMIGKHDASADTSVEAVVNTAGKTPFVERVRYGSTAGFRMALVVNIARYAFLDSYRLAADGRPVPAATTGELTGSLLGKSGTMTTRTTYSDMRPVR